MANDSFSFEDAQREAAAASDGPWKNYAASAPSRDGPWNQYAGQKSGSFSFEEAQGSPENQGGAISDLGKSLKVGVQRLPGVATGLADLPVALATGARPFTRMADYVGEKTGFQPGKWADETKFSQGYEQSKQAVDQAWDQGGVGNIAKAYLTNPGYTANQVVESLPSMVAGGLAGRALMGAGAVAGRAATATQAAREAVPGALERAVGEKAATAISAGAGEGVVTAGQQMQQVTDGDQQKNALAALGAGAATGAIGGVAGRAARAMGLETAETALVNAGRRGAVHAADEVPLSAKRRILGGMVSEAVLQELPQSAQEQMWQNWAEGKPLMDGVARQAVEGSLAGAAMGAGANVSDGGAGKRRVETEKALQRTLDAIRSAEELARKNDPNTAPDWTTSAGAADPNAEPATGTASVANAPGVVDAGFTTSPGAAPAREAGVDFTRDVDTSGLSLQDPAEVERERASRIDYVPGDTTPQWATTAGAAPESQPGLDMPPPTFDTGALQLDTRTPSERLGLDPAAGPLSKAAAMAVDSGATPLVAAPIEPIVRQSIANAPANGAAANLAPTLSRHEPVAIGGIANQPTNPSNGVANGGQTDQAQQGGTQQPQARNQEAAGRAAAPAGAAAPNGGSGVQADGLNRPQNWRTSMLRAGPVARAMGLQTKGKRLAQMVAEIDAADARRAGAPQDGTDLSAGRLNRAWSVFAPETGSLGVPRDQMPQIKAEHRGALVNFLKARGIDSRAEEVPANDLKPTQAEFSPAKVEKARAFKGGDRSILVSSDGYVVDGHHQWLAKRANGEPVKVIRLKAPIQQVLQQVAQFPSTTAAPGTNQDMRSAALAAGERKNGAYPQQASVRTPSGHWQPAVTAEGGALKAIDGAPQFAMSGAAARWGQLEQLKSRPGADIQALQMQQDKIAGRRERGADQPAAETNLGASHATARDLRLADERAPGAGAAASHRTGESVAGAAPAVGAGQRPGDRSAQPAPAVPSAVSGAGGASEPAAAVGQATSTVVDEAEQPTASPKPSAQESTAGAKIDDFGEKLEGARKFLPPSLKEELGDDQIASLPLSKIWPSDAHEAMENPEHAALAFAARAEIPAKPRTAYKVRAWVEKVRMFRAMVTDMKGGLDEMEHRARDGGFRSLAPFFAKVRLLAQLPRDAWSRVEKVGEWPDAQRYAEDGTKTAMPFSSVTIDGRTHTFDDVGRIGPDEVSQIKALLAGDKTKAGALTAADFEIRRRNRDNSVFINRKGDSQRRPLKDFGTGKDALKQARAWLNDNTAEAEAAWEAVKARDNVGKADVRREANRERTGENRRGGKDVTPQMFTDAFGFRGTQFGNWVGQGAGAKDRQGLLNEAYDALLDLAEVLGIPSKAISLDGTLGLSLGARGSGKAAAHFEPSNLVINLTKTRGAGTLAHEWFHALDNYFSRMRGGEVAASDHESYRRGNYITYKPEPAWGKAPITQYTSFLRGDQLRERLQRLPGFTYDSSKSLEENAKAAGWQRDPSHKDGVRPQVEQAFAELVQALNESPMAKRAGLLDKGNGKDGYWSRIIERGARSFENYVISKLAQRGWSNDFLANIRSFDEWSKIGKNAERYPYLKPEEEAPVVAAFDKLFETVQVRSGEDGKVALFSRSASTKAAYEARIDALFAGEKATSGTRVLDRSDVMGLLGHPDVPLMLNERHLLDGLTNHPEMTAAAWKKVPEWLENPAMVYRDPRESGRLVVIAPETLAGYPVMLVVEPAPTPAARGSAEPFQLLVTAYAKTSGNFPVPGYLASSGNLLYVDTKNAPAVLQRAGVQFPGQAVFQQERHKILSEKNLAGYRRANNPAYSQPLRPELANQLLQLQPKPATKESLQAAVRQLVGIGMLPNRLGRVVVATSSEIKQDWEPIIGKTGMEASGEAGQAQGFYDPKTKTVFLIADHINAGDELGVVAHELMHKHGQAVLGEEGWNTLHSVISGWAKAEAGSMERRVYAEAAARVRQSRPSGADVGEYSSQELFPYAVQVSLELGVKPNAFSRPGTVAKWLAQVKLALREVWKKVTGTARGEATFKSQDLVNLAFGIAQRENPAHAGELDGALQGLGLDQFKALDDIYALPKSKATSIEQIARDHGEEVKVRTTDLVGETLHTVTFDNGTEVRITERKANPFGQDQQVYGFDLVDGTAVPTQIGRPGENPEDVPPTGDVWLDVSQNTPAKYGAIAYSIAATLAHNTGQIFIGDPAGLSDKALRRRTEQMLSSALKFGTTEHLAPHPRQVAGDAKLGVPPLKWVYGDHVGNIERMIDVSLDALDNALPNEANTLSFDRATGQFRSSDGNVVQPRASTMGRSLDDYRAGVGKAQAGWRTLARAAYLRSFRGADGRAEGSGILDKSGNDVARFHGGRAGSVFADPKSRIFYSRSVAATSDDYSPAQARAAERVFGVQKKQTLAERAQAMRANLGTKLRQGLVDQFAPIKEVSEKAYILARLSKGSDGAVEAAMLYGKPYLRDGVADVDIKDGGFAKVLASLKGEEVRFFQWVAAHRAERLKAEGKENLLTQQDISDLKTLNAGRMADGTPRLGVYAQALRELNAFNEATLKVAMESGLMDQAAYDLMKDQPYVPFYRLMEDGDMRGPRFSSGLVNQQAWKKLKGGTQQLNADLLQNTLLNWSHLYAAAARNRASLETMAAAEKMGIAYRVSAETKGAVKVMRDGMAEHWAVEDPYLLDAISAMSYAPGGLVKAMAPFKRLLTFGVTVNPAFKIRNLIRDSLSAIAQADLSYNPLANVAGAWKASGSESQTYASMLASGGIIKFGTQENANRVRAQIERLGGEVLDQTGFGKLKGQMRSLWEAYEEFGDRTENVNRVALYERLIAKGHSHAEASFMARDLMDFSMSGKWEVVRFLTQTVPFLNARLQGLYKLGRAAKEDPRRFAAMTGAVAMASMALMMAYSDDDDWKKREDWDRDTYWWFKIGDKAFRIPKPFEVGAIGTLAERTAELMFSKEMTGKRFGQRISDMVFNTFAMDPTPQFIKPFLDVYANKDSFSQRPIEGMADERLRPQDRFNERTSEVARLLGSWGLPDPVRLAKGEYSGLSPKQIDFLLRGYFGWLATVTTAATDAVVRPVLGRGERPAMRLRDAFLAGNFVENLPAGSSRYVTAMYEQARDVEQAWASYQAALKSGDTEQAQSIRESDGSKLRSRMALVHAKRQIAELGQQAKRIESNRLMPAEEKRRRLDEIEERKHRVAQRVAVTS